MLAGARGARVTQKRSVEPVHGVRLEKIGRSALPTRVQILCRTFRRPIESGDSLVPGKFGIGRVPRRTKWGGGVLRVIAILGSHRRGGAEEGDEAGQTFKCVPAKELKHYLLRFERGKMANYRSRYGFATP